MQPAENKDYSRDVILRLSPTRNTIIVEEQKPGGIAAYREIDPLELYYVINQSYASNDYLDSRLSSGTLPSPIHVCHGEVFRALESGTAGRCDLWGQGIPKFSDSPHGVWRAGSGKRQSRGVFHGRRCG